MKKTPRKLALSKETLLSLEIRNRGISPIDDQSCRDSCYLQSCGPEGGCTISTALKG